MFKNIFKTKLKSASDHERSTPSNREKSGHASSPHALEEIHEKPFEIDLDDLNSYDEKELQSFIRKYEQFTSWMSNKYNDMLSEYLMAKERLILMDEERKRLLNQNAQCMTQIESLKTALDEKKTVSLILSEMQSTKSSSPQKDNEPVLDLASLDDEDDTMITELKAKVEKLISDLSSVRGGINKNLETPFEEKATEEEKKPEEDVQEDLSKEKMETNEYVVQETIGEEKFAKDLNKEKEETNEDVVQDTIEAEKLEEDKIENMEAEEKQEESLSQSIEKKGQTDLDPEQDLGKMLEIAEAGLKEILSSYSQFYEKAKSREKELIKKEVAHRTRDEEYERQVLDLKGKVSETQTILEETIKKLKAQEKLLEDEKNKLEEEHEHFNQERNTLQDIIKSREKRIEELQKNIEELNKALKESEERKQEAEKDNDETQGRMKTVQEECNEKLAKLEKIEIELRHDLEVCQKNLHETEEERKKFEKKFNSSETQKNDIENSLIQERLKHHQTTGDLERIKEKLLEMEKSLNEEVEARKVDIRKNEELRKHLVEMERKLKEHRKVINKLSEQVMDLENGVPREKHERTGTEASPSNETKSEQLSTERGETNEIGKYKKEIERLILKGIQDYMEKTLLVNSQANKIQQLEGKLEELMKEIKTLTENNEYLKEDKEVMAHQVKVLQEKRETGLQEIKKLTLLLEKFKGKGQLPEMFIQVDKKNGKADESLKILRGGSMSAIQQNGRNGGNENYECLSKIKHKLEEIYKEIILAITNEKLQESSSERKASGKLGKLVKGPLPSESFIKIEKKMNDTIVNFQEFMENFE